jgi:hypothetical protein
MWPKAKGKEEPWVIEVELLEEDKAFLKKGQEGGITYSVVLRRRVEGKPAFTHKSLQAAAELLEEGIRKNKIRVNLTPDKKGYVLGYSHVSLLPDDEMYVFSCFNRFLRT